MDRFHENNPYASQKSTFRKKLIKRIEFIPVFLLAKLLFYHIRDHTPIIILKYIGRELKMPRYSRLAFSNREKNWQISIVYIPNSPITSLAADKISNMRKLYTHFRSLHSYPVLSRHHSGAHYPHE